MYIYNTLSRKKELLKPIEEGKIGIYICGLTVYDFFHIGNARVFIVFDSVIRYLRTRGYEVFYVRNITDIDDKIIHRAETLGISIKELTEKFIIHMHEDEEALNIVPPNSEPRASEHINEIIAMIDTLIQKGYAYIADTGDIYYDIKKFPHYGELAHQDLENLRAGARVEVSVAKHDPLDFVLWKKVKPDEPFWPAPWGPGRPGWHIECSVMSTLHVGERFDIHGGGLDLKFPHHQNEIAESEAVFGHKVVNVWMHVGFVEINKEKMSKSRGNFFTVREVLKKYHPEVIRFFILSSHYRSPLNYSVENLDNAHAALSRCYTALLDLPLTTENAKTATGIAFQDQFYKALDDDFNTPEALAVLFDITREINRLRNNGELVPAAKLANNLRGFANTLGFLQIKPMEFLQARISLANEEIENLIALRRVARNNKNWAEADRIRNQLDSSGIELEDTSTGTIWKKK